MNRTRPFTPVNVHNGNNVIPHTLILDFKRRISLHGVREVREGIARTMRAESGGDDGLSAARRAECIVRQVQSITVFPGGAGLLLAVPFLLVANNRPADGYGYPDIPARWTLSCHREIVDLLSATSRRYGVETSARRVAVAPQAVWRGMERGTVTAAGIRMQHPVDCDNFIHTGGRGGGSTVAVRFVLVEARLHGAQATDRLQQLFGSGGPLSAVDWQGLLAWGRREFRRLGLCDLLPVYGPVGDVLGGVAAYLNAVTLDLLADAAGMVCKEPVHLAMARSGEENWSRRSEHMRFGTCEEVRVAACAGRKERAVARLCVGSGLTGADVDRALAAHAGRYQPINCDLPASEKGMHERGERHCAGRLAGGP